MRPLLDEPVLPRTRSSLRGSHEGISKKEAASWSASSSPSPSHSPPSTWTKRNHSSFSLLALAVAAGVALGLLFGARDALVRGGAGVQSTLASELAERLESQVNRRGLIDWSLRNRTAFFFSHPEPRPPRPPFSVTKTHQNPVHPARLRPGREGPPRPPAR